MKGSRILAEYRRLFGGRANVRTNHLPRRILGDRHKQHGNAMLKRQREREQQELSARVETENGAGLAKIAEAAAAARLSEKQEELLDAMQKLQKEKLKGFQFGDADVVNKKLQEHHKEAAKRAERVNSMEMRSLATSTQQLVGRTDVPPQFAISFHGRQCRTRVIIVGSKNARNETAKSVLDALPDVTCQYFKEATEKSLGQLFGGQTLVWFFPDDFHLKHLY